MITLSTGEKLEVLLGGAVSATECPIVVEYTENPGDKERSLLLSAGAITTGATEVAVLLGVPDKRKINTFSLYNADSSTVTVTVRYYNAAGTTRILRKQTLLTLQGLHWSESGGWHSIDSSGARITSSAANDGAASSQASSIAAAIVPASINSVSSQASSIAAAIVPASINSVSSQASSVAATNPHTVSSLQSLASVQSFTATAWSTASSAVSRLKTSFTW
jgi:hypothetical protein